MGVNQPSIHAIRRFGRGVAGGGRGGEISPSSREKHES